MKKAIIFGATGQLGCYSAIALKDAGYDVLAVGRREFDGGFFETKNIRFIGGFILENKDSFLKLHDEKFDVVVNMAGTMPAHANADMEPYVKSIVLGTVNICNWMKNLGMKRIIFNTTPSDVYDYWNSNQPIDDDAIRSFPKNGNDHAVYAICKRAATDILEHMMYKENFSPCIFRHFMVYGWHPSPFYNLDGEQRVLPWRKIINDCISKGEVEIYGDSSRLKELLYIKDFADAIVVAANSNVSGIFNLCGYKPYSLDEMVDGIITAFGEKKVKKIYNKEKPDTPQILLSSTKTEKELGWKAKWTWEEACNDMYIEMNENPINLMWGKNQKIK